MSKRELHTHRRIDHRQAEEARRRRLEKRLRAAERRVAKGRLGKAIRCYHALISERPGDLGLLNRLGDLLARCRALDDALGLFLRVANELASQGFGRRAMAIYTKILRLDPGHPIARARRRELGRSLGMPEELAFC